MAARAVLHVTSVPGGGVDRHIRDIARASARRHLVWHAAESGDAVEVLGDERHVFALAPHAVDEDPRAIAEWLRAQGVGMLHVHALTQAPRERARQLAKLLDVPAIVTLHDVLFLSPDAFAHGPAPQPDAAWLRDTAALIGTAAATLAPSEYLAGVARAHLPGIAIDVVANGSGLAFSPDPVPLHALYGTPPFRHVAAVLGAIGPHKGARMLEQVAEALADTDIGIVVIGYMDECNLPGWHRDHLFVHGTYQDAEVASLLRAYGARVGLFTNQVPESFSYTLSDLWAAGIPAIVPSAGALGERVARHGGGWLLPEGFDAARVASLLRTLFSDAGAAELARVESQVHANDPERIPTLDAMSRSLEALYQRFGVDTGPLDPQSQPAQRLLATSLDGSLFRAEMIRFADEIAQLRQGLAYERGEYARVAAGMKEWIAKLEADIAALGAQVAREVAERHEANDALFEQRNENQRSREALRQCEQALQEARAQIERLPRFVQRWLRRSTRDGPG
jgi:glycosyltransferase involved in cell wall biosynthesis